MRYYPILDEFEWLMLLTALHNEKEKRIRQSLEKDISTDKLNLNALQIIIDKLEDVLDKH